MVPLLGNIPTSELACPKLWLVINSEPVGISRRPLAMSSARGKLGAGVVAPGIAVLLSSGVGNQEYFAYLPSWFHDYKTPLLGGLQAFKFKKVQQGFNGVLPLCPRVSRLN